MHHFSIANLTVLALALPVFASLNAPPQQGTTLRPIRIADYEASMGLQRRGSHDLSVLEPQTKADLMYGNTADNGQLLLANMTLYARDHLPIVLLERFEELNVSVKCREDEGTLLLTFGSADTFDYAEKQWGYVNEADDGRFLFIANEDGCGADDQRQPFIVTNMTQDAATLTTTLTAQAVPLSDVAGSYNLDFGHPVAVPQAHRLKRSFGKAILGDFEKSESADFPIDAGRQNQRVNVFTDSNAGLVLDCINCFIAGDISVMGHVLVHDYGVQDLILTASPRSVTAALELEAIITATGDPQPLSYSHQFPDLPIPYAGIAIADLVTLGTSVTYSVGGDCTFSGSASVDFGINASLPDSAQIVADYNNHGASTATGIDGGQIAPMFHINNESASMTLRAFSQPEIRFGIDLKKIGHVDMAVTVKLPELNATLSAESGASGACNPGAGTSVMVDSEASIQVDLEIDGKLGHGSDDDETPLWSTELWSSSVPLTSACYPLDINVPGLSPSPNATTPPTALSLSTTASGVVSGRSAVSTPVRRQGRRWALAPVPSSSAPTIYPSGSYTKTNSSSTGGRVIEVLEDALTDVVGKLIHPPSPTPSCTKSTSIPSSTTSANLETKTSSTFATSLRSSSMESTSKNPETKTVSESTRSRIPVTTESSSIGHVSISSSSSETASVSTPTTSSKSFTIKSSSSTHSTTKSLGTSESPHRTVSESLSSKASRTPSSTVSSTTSERLSTTELSQSTKAGVTSSFLSDASSSTRSSTTKSLNAPKSSQTAKLDTASEGPEVTSSSSRSASVDQPHATVPSSPSVQPDTGSQTVANPPQVTATTANPSATPLFQPVDTVTAHLTQNTATPSIAPIFQPVDTGISHPIPNTVTHSVTPLFQPIDTATSDSTSTTAIPTAVSVSSAVDTATSHPTPKAATPSSSHPVHTETSSHPPPSSTKAADQPPTISVPTASSPPKVTDTHTIANPPKVAPTSAEPPPNKPSVAPTQKPDTSPSPKPAAAEEAGSPSSAKNGLSGPASNQGSSNKHSKNPPV